MSDHFVLGYDGLNRLKGITGPVAESFTLDGASNITGRTGPNQTDTYDTANRLTSDGTSSYTWSNADRLTNRGADTFGYDPLDRMTNSTVAGSARTYLYNGDGLMQSRTGAGAATFLWDPATSPSRELKQGNDNIVYGLGPLYVVKSDATTLTFARDGSKNVRSELSSAGAVTAAFRYRSYGQIAQPSASAPTYLGFSSQLVDSSGLVYMRARWYDPAASKFLTRDPASTDAGTPSSLNSFGYASGNPISLSDPGGTCAPPPGGVGYCIDRFLPQAEACILLLCSEGDTRTQPNPSCESCYRVRILIEADGQRTVRVGESVTDFGPLGLRRGRGSTESCQSEASCAVRHGVLTFAPPIYTEITFDEDGTIHAQGTPFPSLEVWHYAENGDAQLVFFYDAVRAGTGPLDLFQQHNSLPNMIGAGSGGGGGGGRPW
jgi:RHS repeat-associated protein